MKSAIGLLVCAGLAATQNLTSVLTASNETTQLTTLIKGVPGLLEQLSNAKDITILAPNNAAFARFINQSSAAIQQQPGLVPAVLSYHVLNGTIMADQVLKASGPWFPQTLLTNMSYSQVVGGQYLEAVHNSSNVSFVSGGLMNSTVVTADLKFDGGVIHIIDSVLAIPRNISTTAITAGLTGIAGALVDVGLVETVQGLDNITVFAPSNMAFESIGSVVSNATKETLTSVLTYHVVKNSVIFSTDLTDGAKVPTVNGGEITIHKVGSNFFVNDALITLPNVLVENGVVHVIDQVLNPMNATASPASGATAGMVEFQGATSMSSLALTSGISAPSTTITGAASSTSSTVGATNSVEPKGNTAASYKAVPFPLTGFVVLAAGLLI